MTDNLPNRAKFVTLSAFGLVLFVGALTAVAKPKPTFQVFVDQSAFLQAAGDVTVEGFEDLPTESCGTGGLAEATEMAFSNFSVNTRPYILSPDIEDTVFLCIGTAGSPGPTEGLNALIAGSNTGSTYVLEFLLASPTRAVAFDYTDVAEEGDFLLALPDRNETLTISTCCAGPHEGFFGYVAKVAFTRFYVISAGRRDGLGLDRIHLGTNSRRNVPL